MTTITRTATMLRSGLAWRALRQWLAQRASAALAAGVRRILSVPEVQREVARAFSGQTAMCVVLNDAIEDQLGRIEPEDIRGLEHEIGKAVESALDEFRIDAEHVEGLEKFMEEFLEGSSGSVVDNVAEELCRRLGGGR